MELNGRAPELDEIAALALTDYGHFTSMLVEDGAVRGLPLHVARLARDCRALFGVELDVERVRYFLRLAVAGASGPAIARVTIYDPALDLGSIGSDAEPHVLVTTRAASSGGAPPLRVRSVAYRRDDPPIKHVGLYGALRHRREARRDGFDDVVFRDPGGGFSELSTSNIGFVRGGRIVWPRSEVLTGITMSLLDGVLDESSTEPVGPADLGEVEAVFATNAATGIRAVSGVDDERFPAEHEVFDELRRRYADIPPEQV
ncbi:aminotransferase class IV family protein [Saccharopolyspora griseoalba]|uniref:Aminotransferase class IV family protein n=1 Tax=Saccharopolyspora griseoalba TaxID=1431848 RepID=A0ABW2LL71_9PSEU